MKKTLHKTILAASLALTLPLFASQAEALTVLTDWDIDLTGLNGTTQSDTLYTGMGALTGLRDITVLGASSVIQNLSGGSPVGQSFTERGFLSWTNAKTEPAGVPIGPGAMAAFLGENSSAGGTYAGSGFNNIYFEWTALTGTALAGGNITFDNGGVLKLYLDSGQIGLADVGTGFGDRLELASFHVVPLSGGSGIGTDGGAFLSGTVGVTMDADSLLAGVVFRDSFGNAIGSDVLFNFIDIDATIATRASFCTGPNGTGTCGGSPVGAQSFIQSPIEHEGSIVAAVPEPGILSLLAVSLLSFGATAKRRNA